MKVRSIALLATAKHFNIPELRRRRKWISRRMHNASFPDPMYLPLGGHDLW